MAFSPSVGDILMLSQMAWKIGRAFTQGRKSAPAEFAEVEREANALSDALKLVAETLYSDTTVIAQAEDHTRLAVSSILDSAQKTLADLESFVERYRIIRKKETNGGFVVERAWSEVVIANYKTIKWTTEGGDISELRNMLHVHTNTINLTMQALQSKSLSRLEKTVVPMAENVAAIHDRVQGDLGAKIDDLHRIIMTVANGTPSLAARDMDPRRRIASTASSSTLSTLDPLPIAAASPVARILEAPSQQPAPQPLSLRQADRHDLSPESSAAAKARRQAREDSAYYSMGPLHVDSDIRRMDWGFESGFESGLPPPDRDSIAGAPSVESDVAGPSSYQFTPDSLPQRPAIPRRDSTTLPDLFPTSSDHDDAAEGSSVAPGTSHHADPSPISPYSQRSSSSSVAQQHLPPPALPPDPPEGSAPQKPATPSSIFAFARSRQPPNSSQSTSGASTPRPGTAKGSRKRDSARFSSQPIISPAAHSFEKSLFRNAAILCDVRGTLAEYAQHVPGQPDPRYNTEMVEACKGCRVYVICKRENRPHGGSKVISSIWLISDDGAVRCQQRLPEAAETVPYCSYFQPEKVSIPPTHGDMLLRFHPDTWGEEVDREAQTNWVNYVFESEDAANQFQSAVFGRTLLGSFRTTKTTVLHDGLRGAFAFEEQFANIEVLRLWQDDGLATTPAAAGGVLALLHLGSNFGQGWARWWINSSKQQVRVKDEQTKFAKIKGMDVRAVRPCDGTVGGGAAASTNKKKSPERQVTGVRIEFKTEGERARFVALAKRVQERMLPLPDV